MDDNNNNTSSLASFVTVHVKTPRAELIVNLDTRQSPS